MKEKRPSMNVSFVFVDRFANNVFHFHFSFYRIFANIQSLPDYQIYFINDLS